MEIQPDKQNIDQTFSTTVYHIDFYQREYKWGQEPVQRLLDDVFYTFDEAYAKHPGLAPSKENVNARYPWYYLNTYVTNRVDGRVYVVDGQQRLTTLTLILLKLFHLAAHFESKTKPWIERKIAGYTGMEHEFWMHHARHLHVFEGMLKEPSIALEDIDTSSGVTAVNMVANYRTISRFLDARLGDAHRFETFVFFFLNRLVLINLDVDANHVPMVFEVINDRGIRLKPHEILKGKLLGQIDKRELDRGNYNSLWETQVRRLNQYRDDEIDNFFRHWLKAKFTETKKEGQRFDADYHREMLKADLNEALRLDHDAAGVKNFLNGPFRYFTDLYARLWDAARREQKDWPSVYCNHLNDLESQFMVIMAACDVDDPQETEKVEAVAAGLDRLFSLLQLQGAYESNALGRRLNAIAAELRGVALADVAAIFDRHLREEIAEQRNEEASESFAYARFRPMSVDRLNRRFVRYFFARVELLLANGMRKQMPHSLSDLVSSRGSVNGFHIEHILSYNDANRERYDHDEERFSADRNRLGSILLLKGKDNISSGNETFDSKLKTYAGTLLWNQTLCEDTYKSNLDFKAFIEVHRLNLRPMSEFGPEEVEARQRLLFELSRLIWPSRTADLPAGASA
jgi:hypothetical protein